ncbi:MAG: hypothetical protein LBJ94_00490 [Puniceicoccales bacterium]|jgi:hypothetical protein|nr:hypothetical protein [Puniceicoccales bacterium]
MKAINNPQEQVSGNAQLEPKSSPNRPILDRTLSANYFQDTTQQTSSVEINDRNVAKQWAVDAVHSLASGWRKNVLKFCHHFGHRAVLWVLNRLAPVTLESCTPENIEKLANKDKKTLLQCASGEAIGQLLSRGERGKQVFSSLFSTVEPADVALANKCRPYLDNFPNLKLEFSNKIGTYLCDLPLEQLRQSPNSDRKFWLENVSEESLQRLIGGTHKDRQVFSSLFNAVNSEDVILADKCLNCCTAANVENLSNDDKRALLRNASEESLQRLLNGGQEGRVVFQSLLRATGPGDAALRAKYLEYYLPSSLENLSNDDKRALLRNASEESLQRLLSGGQEGRVVFQSLFQALNPEDAALADRCFSCLDRFPGLKHLKSEFLSETNAYLGNLTAEKARLLPGADRRAILKNASEEVLQDLADKVPVGREIFQTLLNALRPTDQDLQQKCLPHVQRVTSQSMQAAASTALENWRKTNPSKRANGEKTFLDSRKMWQGIATAMASSCFDESGKIDLLRARALKLAVEDATFFQGKPFSAIPAMPYMCKQMSCTLGHLINGAERKDSLAEVLNEANQLQDGQLGTNGRKILATMAENQGFSLGPGVAILTSFFSPHRQRVLPSCTMNSTINAEMRNNPDRLARMYRQILTGDTFNLPSGYLVHQQSIGDRHIAIDLSNGYEVKKDQILDPKSQNIQATAGIFRDSKNANGLQILIHDLNDVFFANFFQSSKFGNRGLQGYGDNNYGTTFIYFGVRGYDKTYSPKIDIAEEAIESNIRTLQDYAAKQKAAGMHYMRVCTRQESSAHDENIDIDALLNLKLHGMKPGELHVIGDRNWGSGDGRSMHLAVKKHETPPPAYSFQTVYSDGKISALNRPDIKSFEVYDTSASKTYGQWKIEQDGKIISA